MVCILAIMTSIYPSLIVPFFVSPFFSSSTKSSSRYSLICFSISIVSAFFSSEESSYCFSVVTTKGICDIVDLAAFANWSKVVILDVYANIAPTPANEPTHSAVPYIKAFAAMPYAVEGEMCFGMRRFSFTESLFTLYRPNRIPALTVPSEPAKNVVRETTGGRSITRGERRERSRSKVHPRKNSLSLATLASLRMSSISHTCFLLLGVLVLHFVYAC